MFLCKYINKRNYLFYEGKIKQRTFSSLCFFTKQDTQDWMKTFDHLQHSALENYNNQHEVEQVDLHDLDE